MPGMQGEGPAPQHDVAEKPSITAEELAAAESQVSKIAGVTIGELYQIRDAERENETAVIIPAIHYSRQSNSPGARDYMYVTETGGSNEFVDNVKGGYYLPRENGSTFAAIVVNRKTAKIYTAAIVGETREDEDVYLVPKRFATPLFIKELGEKYSEGTVKYYLSNFITGRENSSQFYDYVEKRGVERIVKGMEVDGTLLFYETSEEAELRLVEEKLKYKQYRNGDYMLSDTPHDLRERRKSILKSLREKAEKIRAAEKQE